MGRLDGKVAVITGAGGGMGREAAILFTRRARRSAPPTCSSAPPRRPRRCAPGTAFAFEVDVADEAQVAAMMQTTAERFGGIDVLYNNAGISPDDDASVLDTSVEAWDRVQNVNTKGVFLCCKHGIPYLRSGRRLGDQRRVVRRDRRRGDVADLLHGVEGRGALDEPRARVQFARDGIRVNALCPGPVETPLLLNIFGDDPAALERRRIHWPTGRLRSRARWSTARSSSRATSPRT